MATEFSQIYINPNLISTTKRGGSPIVNKNGEALARISVPPTEKDGEWGAFFVKADAVKEAKSQTEKGDNYKYVTKPKDYVFHVLYGDKDNQKTVDISAEDMAKRFNHKAKTKDAEKEAEQEGPELE